MEQEHYEINIENWASSIALEENIQESEPISLQSKSSTSSLISLGTPTYYRSKAFSSSVGINKLINAADPILTLLTQLSRITIPSDTSLLYQHICHEIKAFENKVQTLEYRPALLLAARYTLCVVLDELIPITMWPEKELNKYSFVEAFHKDMTEEGDRFFMILERSMQDPNNHVDLLELIYICLRLGYEGKYRTIERGHLELRSITDSLYNTITQTKEELSRGLLICTENPQFFSSKKNSYSHLLPPTWIISTLVILILITVFIFFYIKLMDAAAPISQLLSSLQPIEESTQAILPIAHLRG